jgi:hypothetical protein
MVIKIIGMFYFKRQSHLSLTEFVKWILPFCPNIETFKIRLMEQPNDLHNEIVRLEKLKDLHIVNCAGIHPKEVKSVSFLTKTTLLTSS